MASFDSTTYPYERVQTGYLRFDGANLIPMKVVKYLLDLPDMNGYQPVDDNSRPRVRIAKYLWHDGRNPLGKALPTPKEKLSMVFDGEMPVLNEKDEKERHPKGYRLYPQVYWGQTELEAKVVIKCYMGRVIPYSEFGARIGLAFDILVNVNLENTSGLDDSYSRAYAIECDLINALHGVNIAGVGAIEFNKYAHGDDGSYPIHDNGVHVGRSLHFSIDWMESGDCEGIEGCG